MDRYGRHGTLVLMLGVLMSGCVATGTKIDQGRLGEVEKGRTTYAEVVRLYGKPNQVLLREDGTRQASFTYAQTQVNPLSFLPMVGMFVRRGSTEHTSTVFEFDAQGVLVGYSSMQGETVTGTGIVSGQRQ